MYVQGYTFLKSLCCCCLSRGSNRPL